MPYKLFHFNVKQPKATLLFIHGSFSSASIWFERFIPYFQENDYECFAISLRGHDPEKLDFNLHFYGMDNYMRDVQNAIIEIGKPLTLIGHSLGGMVVQKYIEKGSCQGCVLLNSLPPSGAFSTLHHLLTYNPDLLFSLNQALWFGPQAVSFAQFKRLLVTDETHPASLAQAHSSLQAESLRAIHDVTFWDVPRRKPENKMPILVLGTTDDAMVPVSALKETQAFYECDLEILDGVGHAVMLDQNWEMVAERLDNWLSRCVL